MKDNIVLWRINIHTHESKDKQVLTFNYCKSKNILGIGWETKYNIGNSNHDINKIVNEHISFKPNWNSSSFKKVLKAYFEIKKDDLIWTRSGSIYYLCRVLGNKVDYIRNEMSPEEQKEHDNYDIWHGIKCEILEVGTEEKVNGDIVDSFNVGTICKIQKNRDVTTNFSKALYNKLTNKNYYKVDQIKNNNDMWSNIKPDQLEELIILYLQIKKNYGIYSSTCKKSTKTQECVLFSRNDGSLAYVQIKKGPINIGDLNYKNIYIKNKFYFFSNINQYGKYEKNKNIIIINKKEIEDFITKYKKIVSFIGWPLG